MAQAGSADRGVTISVAIVLMIAITILLGIIAASGVFSQLDPYSVSEPQIDAAYFYSEDEDPETVDSFGVNGNPQGDGLAQIKIQSITEAIDADQITLIVGGTEYNWANNQTDYSAADSITVGDTVSVWADRGDEILLTWETENGERSFVIDTYTIPEFETASQLPDADEDCSWVESQLGSPGFSGDLTIDGIIVECDLDQYDVQNLDIINGGGVIGEVEANGNININDGTTWEGDVEMLSGGGDLILNDESEVNGNIDAQGNVNIDDSSEVEGYINAEGNVQINNDSAVGGDIESTNSGDITVTDTSTILGAVATAGGIDVDSGTVQGHAYLDGSWNCDNGAQIKGQSCSTYTPKNYGEYS